MVWIGIDTATRRGSVALAPRPADVRLLSPGGGHAPELLEAIDGLLGRHRLDRNAIAGIGVALGPGSFTGVRVGIATAKGLGYALGVPVGGLSTLELLARGAAAPAGAVVCAAIEAGRGEVYTARFLVREGGRLERQTPDSAERPSLLAAALSAGALLVGDGSELVRAQAHDAPRVLAPEPLAPLLADWAAETMPPGTGYEAGGPVPNYIRPSDAAPSRPRP